MNIEKMIQDEIEARKGELMELWREAWADGVHTDFYSFAEQIIMVEEGIIE